MDPTGKVALITGGAARVGRAIALQLAHDGAHVAVHYNRSDQAARETAARARDMGVEAQAMQADLTDPRATRALVDELDARFGGVDIIVHAASPFIRASLTETTLAEWRQVMGVLVESFLLLAQGLTPHMIEKDEGCMIAILDRGVYDPWPQYLAHGVGKSALWALARTLAVELAPQVRVTGIVPGPVLPPAALGQRVKRRLADDTLLGRWGNPQDVAQAVSFLIHSEYVTGEVLFIDGGERWAHRRPKPKGEQP